MSFGFLHIFSMFGPLLSELDFSFLKNARLLHKVAVRHLFAFALHIFQTEVNDENWLNVLSTRYLEKGTLECRNVGIKINDRIKYCYQTTYISLTFYSFEYIYI